MKGPKVVFPSFQEIPYVIDHRLMDWKELRDGSLRVEQHFITPKQSQRQILVGKNGSKIGYSLTLFWFSTVYAEKMF